MRISDWSSDVCSSDLVPAFCRERLVALAPVVALHQSRTAQPELAHLTCGEVGAGVGVDDPRLEPGHGTAERPAPVLGLVALIVAGPADAAGLRHAGPDVPQPRTGRADPPGHDRPQDAPPRRT